VPKEGGRQHEHSTSNVLTSPFSTSASAHRYSLSREYQERLSSGSSMKIFEHPVKGQWTRPHYHYIHKGCCLRRHLSYLGGFIVDKRREDAPVSVHSVHVIPFRRPTVHCGTSEASRTWRALPPPPVSSSTLAFLQRGVILHHTPPPQVLSPAQTMARYGPGLPLYSSETSVLPRDNTGTCANVTASCRHYRELYRRRSLPLSFKRS
jgi:hypothetical protein